MASEWFYTLNGERHGPVSSQELRRLAKAGTLTPSNLLWKKGMKDWRPASEAQKLFDGVPTWDAGSQKATEAITIAVASSPRKAEKSRSETGFLASLVLMVLVGSSVIAMTMLLTRERAWDEGGTLHQASALRWQTATAEDRLATCADFVFNAHEKGLLKQEISNQIVTRDDTRFLAEQLRDCLDKALIPERDAEKNRSMYANQKVSECAAACATLMGWLR